MFEFFFGQTVKWHVLKRQEEDSYDENNGHFVTLTEIG